jgi:asparagine synthetase B (glutamine-hydrolysing)
MTANDITKETHFSDLLESVMRKAIPEHENTVAVLLSGGMDSVSLALSAQRIGKHVHAYSFYCDDSPSYDSLKAQDVSNEFGFAFTPINVPTDNLRFDFVRLANIYLCEKKTHFETTFPMMYVIPEIQERIVLVGIGADGHFGMSKSAMMHHIRPKEKFDKLRHTVFHGPNNPNRTDGGPVHPTSDRRFLQMLCNENERRLLMPYTFTEIFDYFIQFEWDEINKPQQKYLVRKCYPELESLKIKPHLNYQLVSGVSTAFERLLDDPEINFANRSRIMDICRDWHYANSAA